MSARRRKRHEEPEEHENEERWMASYMDMVTVLMCMFIVLFAMSTVDAKKFEQLKDSLATGFGQVKTQKVDTASGVVVPPKHVDESGKSTDFALAQQEAQNLQHLKDLIQAALTRDGLQDAVELKIDERGLTIGLVGNSTFFDSNRAELSPRAVSVLNDIGPVLAPEAYEVSVEGHADLRQPGAPYPTNWELSAGRATSVLRHLVEVNGFPQERIAAVSFGSARPVAGHTGTTDSDLAQNRRVDVVVLSSQPDAIRKLIPQALQSPAPTTAPAASR
ncbi:MULTISPECIES: OmpA/MotB family protein [Microbacteriaceae]|jgi:chemotaxis protein MotB|uniref:OmpA/MotB family protein n=1 Tax=Microbacteriaceae TaxID=85023 RepID=UPI00037E4C3C|nr:MULTISPECIES: flagellar motor protein MotB [Microbacteriaceae]SDG96734.1 chemotaxis protein MotB [Leifsonia sp. 197AMF]SDJ44723.1 chemotaxis protein MotB [Leifsonia sp. 466MF]SDK31436.1 chemotaxis protein MotB [Leifsonia sp. 157MF]SDN65035.1 chemotaxis protein MotB [Leifsonia sp. 509MF]SEN43710.1 chemotaxis protein MotB [Leifsonia sp. 467MF]